MKGGDRAWGVGLTYVRIRVSKKASTPARSVRVLVDTGATYTMLPGTLLREIGIVPSERERVRLGDGRLVEWGLGQAYVRYGRYETPTWILFGENRSLSALGALTLEELRLHVDPRSRRLRKTKIAVMAHAALSPKALRSHLLPDARESRKSFRAGFD